MVDDKTAVVIAIGTELMLGISPETNSVLLSRWLGRLGFETAEVLRLPDKQEAVAAAINRLAGSVSVIVVSGGLGATHDDLTRDALVAATDRPLVADPDIEVELSRHIPPGADRRAFMKQARLPLDAEAIGPMTGTTSGIAMVYAGTLILAFPGVPAEMSAMLPTAGDMITRRFGPGDEIISKTIHMIAASEPTVAAMIAPIIKSFPDLKFNILAKVDSVAITAIGSSDNAAMIKTATEELAKSLGALCLSPDAADLPDAIARRLLEAGYALAVAESITGGGIGAEIVTRPGSSKYFRGGIIAYGNDAKEKLLGVSHETLVSHGAVSAETASAMADGVRAALNVEVGLAVTGIAGPTGATSEKPVGLVYTGISSPLGTEVKKLELAGDRNKIRKRAIALSLNQLRLHLSAVGDA